MTDLLTELSDIVNDAKAYRKRPSEVTTLYGWTKEQWAWAMLKHTLDSHAAFDFRVLTTDQALEIQTWWRRVFYKVEPPTWASDLFSRAAGRTCYIWPGAT